MIPYDDLPTSSVIMIPPRFNPVSVTITSNWGFAMPVYAAWLFNHICVLPCDRDIFDMITSDMEEFGAPESEIAIVIDAMLEMAGTLYSHLRLNPQLHFLFTGTVCQVDEDPYTRAWEVYFEPDYTKLEHASIYSDTWGWMSNVPKPNQPSLFY